MRSQRAYVEHILECIRRVREDSAPGQEVVFASRTLQDAILRNLQRIDQRYRQKRSETDWRSIAGMRNVLVHDYFAVDFKAAWQIVERDLPPLERTMRVILAEIDQLPR